MRGLELMTSVLRQPEAALCGCCDLLFYVFTYIPIGKLITAIPRRTLVAEPRPTSIGGFLFVAIQFRQVRYIMLCGRRFDSCANGGVAHLLWPLL
jgi:hypothetical protein